MKERFEGDGGEDRLIAVLLDQRVIEHSSELAKALIAKGELVEFTEDDTVIEQGGYDTWAYFILAGSMKVFINHRLVAIRGPRELVGEMVSLDLSAPRSGTLKASAHTVALRIAGGDLGAVANSYPSVWRAIGRVLSERLRERARFHRPQNLEPIVFLGCSTEALPLAQEIEVQFKHDIICFRPWTSGIFGAGGVVFDDLLKQVQEVDFALFLVTPDDKVQSRATEQMAPRDNVVFEMGLFMDRLGRERAFLLREHGLDLKIPTDLLGITHLTYLRNGSRLLADQLRPACNELRKLIRGLGAL